jgi:hypothetical protein
MIVFLAVGLLVRRLDRRAEVQRPPRTPSGYTEADSRKGFFLGTSRQGSGVGRDVTHHASAGAGAPELNTDAHPASRTSNRDGSGQHAYVRPRVPQAPSGGDSCSGSSCGHCGPPVGNWLRA